MFKYISKKEFSISLLLIIAVLLYLNPFHMYMLSMGSMVILGALVILVGLFAGLILHGNVRDEREVAHRDFAGRWPYTVGVIAITIRIFVGALSSSSLDSWWLIILLIIILVKVGIQIYSRSAR